MDKQRGYMACRYATEGIFVVRKKFAFLLTVIEPYSLLKPWGRKQPFSVAGG